MDVGRAVDVSAFYKTLGQCLRREREKRKISQEDLAQQIGLSRTSITNIEKGRQRVLIHTLVQISTTLGISPSEFFKDFETDDRKLDEIMPHNSTPNVKKWIAAALASTKYKHELK